MRLFCRKSLNSDCRDSPVVAISLCLTCYAPCRSSGRDAPACLGRRGGRVCGVPVVGRRRPLGLLAASAGCVRTPPLQLQPCSPIRLVTGLRPPPRPITGPRLEYRVWVLYVWYGTC